MQLSMLLPLLHNSFYALCLFNHVMIVDSNCIFPLRVKFNDFRQVLDWTNNCLQCLVKLPCMLDRVELLHKLVDFNRSISAWNIRRIRQKAVLWPLVILGQVHVAH